MNKTLPGLLLKYGPGWTSAFGPVVYKQDATDNTSTADNVWFVSYNPALVYENGTSYPTFVVSVAGTQQTPLYWVNDAEVSRGVNTTD